MISVHTYYGVFHFAREQERDEKVLVQIYILLFYLFTRAYHIGTYVVLNILVVLKMLLEGQVVQK